MDWAGGSAKDKALQQRRHLNSVRSAARGRGLWSNRGNLVPSVLVDYLGHYLIGEPARGLSS
jgi:hypothetical protein